MKVAAFQFRGSDSIESNLKAIERGIEKASKEDVRFLITQECALCGYPPVETEKIGTINFELMNYAKKRIKQLAAEKNMYIGLGLIRQNKDKVFNSIEMVAPILPTMIEKCREKI
jgi:omega-amidase